MPPNTAPRHPEPHVARVIALFEGLQPADLARLGDFYAADARFKDPFNDVTGLAAVARVYGHMFEALGTPRFTVLQAIGSGADVVLTWDFDFRLGRRPLRIHGASHLVFDVGGRIVLHRDYWDAAEELYAKLPWLGVLMRALQRRLATPLSD
ncbi:MAG: nuclear transport factor 2 family protein [Burkholderiaceae bacterium]